MGGSASSQDYPASVVVACPADSPWAELSGRYARLLAKSEITLTRDEAAAAGNDIAPPGRHTDGKVGISISFDLILRRVFEDTPAAAAGMGAFIGRTLTHVNGTAVTTAEQAFSLISESVSVVFTFQKEEVWCNSLPVWALGDARLYSTVEGKWMLTGQGDEGMGKSRGKLMTSAHASQGPDEEFQWMSYKEGKWEVAEGVSVTAVADEPVTEA